MNMKKIILLTGIWAIGLSAFAQRFSGNALSNYGGIYSVQENPATFVNKKPQWDINLIGMGVHFNSDYGYLQDQSVFSLLGAATIRDAQDTTQMKQYNASTDALFIANQYTDPIRGLQFNSTITLPSVLFNFNRMSIGLINTSRVYADGYDIPNFFNYSNLKNLINYRNYQINPFNINAMAWSEIGLNLAYQHTLNNDNALAIGVNIKYLLGHEAYYIQNKTTYDFTKEFDTFNGETANLTLGFATGASKTDNSYKFGVNGTGIGFDIGMEYLIPNDDEESNINYKMKIGGSLRDLGVITFNKNAEEHNYTINDIPFETYNFVMRGKANNYQPLQRVSYWVYGDSAKSLQKREITMYLPASLNLHFDYNLNDFVFLNAAITRRMSSNAAQVSAPNVLMVGGRYERRWFEAGGNFNLVEDNWVGMGAYFRIGPFTIGSDHINTFFFSQPKFRGSDFYFSFRAPIFAKADKINTGFLGLGNLFKKKDKASRSNLDDSGHWKDKNWNKDKSGGNSNTGNAGKGKKNSKCATYK